MGQRGGCRFVSSGGPRGAQIRERASMSTLSIILIVVIVLLGSFIAVRLSSTAAREARAVRATDVADAALEKQLGKAIQAEEVL